MPKDKRPGSGKDRGSLTQKADDQNVRISQVSNVSAAVSAMGKETTRRMKETDRRVAEGAETKEIAGSMNGVLMSLKKTVDSLEKGVNAATLGTAKAAQDAIKQYGQAISEDFKVNRSNMVASSMAAATPLVGYFASKLLETGILKKTKESINEKISGLFKKKEAADEFGIGTNGQNAAAALKQSKDRAKEEKKKEKRVALLKKQAEKREKTATMSVFSSIFKKKHKEYEEPANQQMLLALNAIRDHLVKQEEKEKGFEAWARRNPLLSLPFRPFYWFFKARGGYKRFLSKAKSPLTAINQNIGTTFLQMMPRLDALMVYTRATAEAVRDLSTHTTRKTYPRLDPSKLGDTWSIAGTTWKAVKFLAGLPVKAMAMPITKMLEWTVQGDPEAQKTLEFFTKQRQLTKPKTKPGLFAKYEEKMKFEEKRLMGKGPFAVGATAFEEIEEGAGRAMAAKLIQIQSPKMIVMAQKVGIMRGKAPGRKLLEGPGDVIDAEYTVEKEKKESRLRKFFSKIRMPKYFKGMGRREKPHTITQGVYDLYKVHMEQEKNKRDKKKLGMFAKMTKYLKQHDQREKRKAVFGFFGTIFRGIGGILRTVMGFLGPIFGMFKTGLSKFLTGLLTKGGPILGALAGLFAKGGPIMAALSSPWLWGPIGAALLGAGLGTAINTWLIQPFVKHWGSKWDKEREEARKKAGKERKADVDLARGGASTAEEAYYARVRRAAESSLYAEERKKDLSGALTGSLDKRFDKINEGQMNVVKANISEYAKFDPELLKAYRNEWLRGEGGAAFGGGRWVFQNPVKYGERRETAFLNWLKRKGKVVDKASAITAHGEAIKRKNEAEARKDAATLTTASQIEKIAKEYGVPKAELIGKTLAEATEYAKKRKEEIAKAVKESPNVAAGKEMLTTSKEYWKSRDLTAEKAGVAGVLSTAGQFWAGPLQKTQEYIEVAKGTYLPIYRQSKAQIKEMWNNAATPERKAMVKRELETLLASGQITAAELERMGIKLEGATKEAGKGIEKTVAATGVYQTNNITETMSQTNVGGGGGNQQKFIQEQTMDDIAMGDVLF